MRPALLLLLPALACSPGAGGDQASAYCYNFDDTAPEPFLVFHDDLGEPLEDGDPLRLECGGQGLWMFGLYPELGGYDPKSDRIGFDVTVDVAGYNDNPAGHFYSNSSVTYYIGCEDVEGGVMGVVPILLPDTLADPSVLDGLIAEVRVEVDAGGQTLRYEAAMPLVAKASPDAGCISGY